METDVEELIPLAAACELLPKRRLGKRPHVSCLYRWAAAGLKGVVLQTVQVGGTKCTSRRMLAEFCRQLSRNPVQTLKKSQASDAQAELAKEGFS